MHIYEIQKSGIDEPIFRERIETYREWTCGHGGVRREQDEWSKQHGYIYTTAKSHQPCPTLPAHRRQHNRLPRSWDSPGKNTGVGCHFLLQCMKVKSESDVAQSCLTWRPHGLQPTRLLRPWDFPGKSSGVGCHCHLLLMGYKLASPLGIVGNPIKMANLDPLIKQLLISSSSYTHGCDDRGTYY